MGWKLEEILSATQIHVSPELKGSAKHLGYGIAVVINVVMLIVVLNILDWGWLSFLTDEFVEVVPWIALSLVASIIVNLIYQFNDTVLVKSTGQIGTNLISIFVTYQVFRVFPFDFSAFDFDPGTVLRVVLILAMVGSAIGVFVEALKLMNYDPESGQG
jgi:hypothetical protein